jgi:hypothetical protein
MSFVFSGECPGLPWRRVLSVTGASAWLVPSGTVSLMLAGSLELASPLARRIDVCGKRGIGKGRLDGGNL